MAFVDEVQRIVAEISRRMAALGNGGPTPDFWALVTSRLAEEAQRLGVDRLALMIAVQSALADQNDDAGPSSAMTDLLAPLRAVPSGGDDLTPAQIADAGRTLLSAVVSYVVQEAYKGSPLSFWHVLVARLRAEARRGAYPGPALLEEVLTAVREQTGVDATRRPNEAAVVLCRRQLQRDFQDFAARNGTLRLVIYPDGSVTYRTVGIDDQEPEGNPPGAGELYSDSDSTYTAVEEGDEDDDEAQ